MKSAYISMAFVLCFIEGTNAQSYNTKIYTDTYNNIVKYYNKPAAGSYNYNPPAGNNNNYTPGNNSSTYSGSYSNNTTSSYPDPSSPTYYVYAKMYFAKTADGAGGGNNFKVTSTDGLVYGFLAHPAGLQTTSFKVRFYKMIKNKSTLLDEVTYNTDKRDYTSVWFQYDFSKLGAGEYYLDAYTLNGTIIALGSLTIKANFSNDEPVGRENDNTPDKPEVYRDAGSEKFKNSTLVFCERIEGGNPVGVYSNFVISPAGGVVQLYVTLPVAINSTHIYFDIKKYDPYKSAYPNAADSYKRYKEITDKKAYDYYFVERLEQKTDLGYTLIWYGYDFAKHGPGFYKIEAYTYEGVYIQSGEVEIKPAN